MNGEKDVLPITLLIVLVVYVSMLDDSFLCIKLHRKSGFTFYWGEGVGL